MFKEDYIGKLTVFDQISWYSIYFYSTLIHKCNIFSYQSIWIFFNIFYPILQLYTSPYDLEIFVRNVLNVIKEWENDLNYEFENKHGENNKNR